MQEPKSQNIGIKDITIDDTNNIPNKSRNTLKKMKTRPDKLILDSEYDDEPPTKYLQELFTL